METNKKPKNNQEPQEPFVTNNYGLPPVQGQQFEMMVDGVTSYIQMKDRANERRVPDPPKNEEERLKRLNDTLTLQNQQLTQEVTTLRNSLEAERYRIRDLNDKIDFHINDKKSLREVVKALRAENASLFSRLELLEQKVIDLTEDDLPF